MNKVLLILLIILTACFFSCKKKDKKKSGDKLFTFNNLKSDNDTIKQGNVTNIRADISGSATYTWAVTAGDVFGNGNTVMFGASTCCVGIHTISCTVKDQNDNSETRSVNVFVK